MHAFRAARGGYATRMDDVERTIVGRVVADVAHLLGHPVGQALPGPDGLPEMDWGSVGMGDGDGTVGQTGGGVGSHQSASTAREGLPDDPALARLLPNASEDPDIAAELRGLSEAGLRSAKAARLHAVWADLQGGAKIVVPGERAMDWAGALTDVRLVLAQRLGVSDAADAEALEAVATTGTDEVSRALATLYLALSWLQESLLTAMLADLPDGVAEGQDPAQ